MDGFEAEVLARLPLAEAAWQVWRWAADEDHLREVFESSRGRCYEKQLSFPMMVHLVAEALLHYGGSGRQSFEHAAERGALPASIQAGFGKLGRLPIAVSNRFLGSCAGRLLEVFPEGSTRALSFGGACAEDFHPIVLDGKTIKGVAKRLKPLRGARGGVLGGSALVALSLPTGLAVGMHGDPDGDANEVRFLAEVVAQVRAQIAAPRLWICDRAFCNVKSVEPLAAEGDRFIVRYRRNVCFTADASIAPRRLPDAAGRPVVEEWGWLGTKRQPQARRVRRITLERADDEDVILVTNLLDSTGYATGDILEMYLNRWGIERMFQEVTEVFGLQRLIGSSPRATVFQFAFCLVLYNTIQVVRHYLAAAQSRPVESISTEKLFVDVRREWTAWNMLIPASATVVYLSSTTTPAAVRERLRVLLAEKWTKRWIKSPPKKRKPPAPKRPRARTHCSAQRLIEAHAQHTRRNRRRR